MKMSKITQKRAPNFKLPSTNTGIFELNKIKSKYKVENLMDFPGH